MENNETKTQATNTSDVATNEGNDGKTFSQADLDKLASKVRGEEKAKSDIAIKEAVANAIAEYERKAKMSEEEREKEAKARYESELQERESAITLKERRFAGLEMLSQKGLDKDLIDYVVDSDEKTMLNNIEKLSKVFNKNVEATVQEKLKGKAPVDFTAKSTTVSKNVGAF